MNIHEYQGQKILSKYGVKVPKSFLAKTENEAVEAGKKLQELGFDKFVVKAQIHAGGRGKGGGVKVATSLEELKTHSSNIIGMDLITPQTSKEGKKVHQILVVQNVFYEGENEPSEIYMSILLNRSTGRNMIVYSSDGGMDIEAVAEKTPERVFNEEIDPSVGLENFQARKIAFNLGLEGKAYKEMVSFVTKLYEAYVGSDASLFEINPVLKTSDNQIMAIDTKVSLDENALYRHKDLEGMRDEREEDVQELEAKSVGLNYVKLDGNVGCMVNGAGLAMATMDLIKLSGGNPANFLDVGGTADAKRVETAFRIILKDKNVKIILVNIFGGIVRCDRIANGIIDAYKNIGDINIPIVVRLQGTNSEEAGKIIKNSGLKVHSVDTLNDANETIKEIFKKLIYEKYFIFRRNRDNRNNTYNISIIIAFWR